MTWAYIDETMRVVFRRIGDVTESRLAAALSPEELAEVPPFVIDRPALIERAKAEARIECQPIIDVLDSLHASSIAQGNLTRAQVIETAKQGLRDISVKDLSAYTTYEDMRLAVKSAYYKLAAEYSADAAAVSGFKAAGTGSVWRTLSNKLSEIVSVKDYGAVGDGVADDTTAINAAITANPGKIINFPVGTYKITSSILLNQTGTRLQGNALWGVQISCATLNTPIINISAQFCTVDALSVVYAGGTPVAGASGIYVNASAVSLTNFVVRNGYNGMQVTSLGAAMVASDFDILDYESTGILLTNVNDVFLSDFILNAGNLTRGANGGIRLFDNVQALVVQNGDVISGAYGMTMDATVNAYNQRPSYNKFTNVYFDSTNRGVSLNKTVSTTFESCWFASTKAGFGVQLTGCDSIVFQKCEIVNNWQHGAVVQTGSSRVIFESCRVFSNGQQTAGTYHGIVFVAGVADFRVQGNIVGNHIGFNPTQQFGIIVSAGGSDRYIIADNLVNNNLSTPVSDGGTGVNKRVANNY